jgi:GGDEF domain-containing protein
VEGFPNGILLFVNSTPEVFCDERFVETIEADVRAVPGLTPSRIVLEITERGGADDLGRIARQVVRLRALGFQIAIDDVGAGTSGLNRIMMLRPHWLKLDRELVSGIDKDRYKLNLIRFLVHFARLAGVNVIGEGVERREEMTTLVNLGVRYQQGYLLGRPAPAYQRVDEATSRAMRDAWASAEAARLIDPRRTQLSRLCEPPQRVQAATPVREVALDLLRAPAGPGVAVLDGARLVGWATRETVLNAARRTDARLPIGFICTSDLGTLPPSATLSEAMEHVASRDGASIADPVLVAEHDRIVGVVTLKQLLGACSREGRIDAASSVGVAGLPGKIEAEKRVRRLIAQGQGGLCAAFMDVRGFADFNGACGYEAGDRLISELAGLARAAVEEPPAEGSGAGEAGDGREWTVAHVGDDRFMFIAPALFVRERWAQIVRGFLSLFPGAERLADAAAPGADVAQPLAGAGARLGLRLVLLDEVFSRVGSPRELSELEAAVRRAARASEDACGARCVLHEDVPAGSAPARRAAG